MLFRLLISALILARVGFIAPSGQSTKLNLPTGIANPGTINLAPLALFVETLSSYSAA